MPSRPTLYGTGAASTSPRQSSHSVNDVFHAVSKKIQSAVHVEAINPSPSPPVRRGSVSPMDSILHHKKDKKHGEHKDAHGQKRMSLTPRNSHHKPGKASPASSPGLVAVKPGHFENIVESPPLVFYGTPANSTGALLSGRLKLVIEDPTKQVTFNSFSMICRATIVTKKPVSKDCKDCIEKYDDLKTWNFLSEPKTFYAERDNQFPYSFLMPGALPASTVSQLGSISYALIATAKTANGEKITFAHPLTLSRAIAPGPDKTSVRIFPPTNLNGRVQLPPVVHPIGQFPVSMSLTGVVERKQDTYTRWRLRKLLWRVEEQSKVVSSPCSKHAHKLSDGKAVQHSETRILGQDEIKTGWKTDFDTAGGEVVLEFDASVTTKSNQKVTCDVASAAGLSVNHTLVLELIVAEEYAPLKNSQMITPTGAARVLRMQFALVVTERAGMGISWDEEQPPMYEDVPDSPPGYGSADKNDGAWGGAMIEDYNGPELEYVELELMPSSNPNDPPQYRERDVPRQNSMNHGLPMRTRDRRRTDSPDAAVAGPSGQQRRYGGFTATELEEEPQYSLRGRQASADAEAVEEDIATGSADAAPQESSR